ncbi:hypothetical protein GX48_06028 [Paracoccidioides brasiliensis]|nr:hypothetical protein GX48_06028 [Paracoccidioides brasiliensis]
MRSISIIKYRVRNATIEDGYQSRAAQQIESPSIIFEPKFELASIRHSFSPPRNLGTWAVHQSPDPKLA